MDANNTNDLLSALIFIVGASHFDNYNLHYYKAVWTKGGIGGICDRSYWYSHLFLWYSTFLAMDSYPQ
jgi:hypothetical protein